MAERDLLFLDDLAADLAKYDTAAIEHTRSRFLKLRYFRASKEIDIA